MTGNGKRVLAAMVLGLGLSCAVSARGADEVDNPRYLAWSKFGVGSSQTLSADQQVGPNKLDVHVDLVTTLKSVNADELETETRAKVTAMGNTNNPIPVTNSLKAKIAPSDDMKENGAADVDAMGKTFHCRVVELTGDAAAGAGSTAPGSKAHPSKVTLYISNDVPGGRVKMESISADGKNTTTFLLTAMEAK